MSRAIKQNYMVELYTELARFEMRNMTLSCGLQLKLDFQT